MGGKQKIEKRNVHNKEQNIGRNWPGRVSCDLVLVSPSVSGQNSKVACTLRHRNRSRNPRDLMRAMEKSGARQEEYKRGREEEEATATWGTSRKTYVAELLCRLCRAAPQSASSEFLSFPTSTLCLLRAFGTHQLLENS